MAPNTKCVNCGASDWLKNENISYIPVVVGSGNTQMTPTDGLHVEMWMCKSCWYLMPFGSST